MAIRVQVTFDAADPQRLAAFWALALDYEPQRPPPGFHTWEQFAERIGLPQEEWDSRAAVIDPDEKGPRLFFQRVPEGKTAKNRVHLDLNLSGSAEHSEENWQRVRAHVAKLVEAGATELREQHDPTGHCVVLQDPEGNEFCVQ